MNTATTRIATIQVSTEPPGGAMLTTTAAKAAEFLATEIAWNGSATDKWIAETLAGHDVEASRVVEFAVAAGLLRPIPRLGGYTVTRKVNARVFGRKFAEWVAA